MSIRLRWIAALALPALLGVSQAAAQQQLEDRQQQRQQRRGELRENLRGAAQRVGDVVSDVAGALGTERDAQTNDALIAGILIPANQEEIELSRMAAQRSENPHVQQFAQQMVTDHTQFVNQLRQFTGMAAGPADPQAPGAPGADRDLDRAAPAQQPRQQPGQQPQQQQLQPQQPQQQPGQQQLQQPGQPGAQPDRRGPQAADRPLQDDDTLAQQTGGVDVIQLHRQIGERSLAKYREMLQEKEGAEFDKAYVGLNIPAHVRMVASLEVVQDYASPELRQVLEQGTQTTREHLDKAIELMRQLDNGNENAGRDQPANERQNQIQPGLQ